METKNLYMVRIKTVREKKVPYCGESLTSAEKACDIVRPIIGDSDKEVVITMCLDGKLRPVTIERTAIGTLDQCMVLPKEILKTAILSNAKGIMVFHNHPSGIKPSKNGKSTVLGYASSRKGNVRLTAFAVSKDRYSGKYRNSYPASFSVRMPAGRSL